MISGAPSDPRMVTASADGYRAAPPTIAEPAYFPNSSWSATSASNSSVPGTTSGPISGPTNSARKSMIAILSCP